MLGNVVKPMVSAALILEMLKNNGSGNIVFGHIAKTIVLATLLFGML